MQWSGVQTDEQTAPKLLALPRALLIAPRERLLANTKTLIPKEACAKSGDVDLHATVTSASGRNAAEMLFLPIW